MTRLKTIPFRIVKSVDRHFSRLFAKSDGLSRIYEQFSIALSPSARRPPVLLYQFGRVGSHTIQDSLESWQKNERIHHVHFLSEQGQREFESHYVNNPYFVGRGQRYAVRNQFLLKTICKARGMEPWRIVTGVRDPIERNVSMFFTMIRAHFPETRCYERMRGSDYEGLVQELMKLFLEKFNHDTPLTWFDDELKEVFGVDVYAEPFDMQKGYQIYANGNTRVLLIRTENLSKCAVEAFELFFGAGGFKLAPAPHSWRNQPAYERFLEELILPDSYIDRMYGSKFARHFYTEEQLAGFRKKWTKNRAVKGP
jgi:hypothetical protein